jgi:protein-arginine kinase activator protein McsA
MARYKFQCRSCKFECISGIGKEVGLHSSRVVMVCKSCAAIDTYTVPHPGSINSEITRSPVCTACHSSDHLSDWDGLTCPHCHMKMRALGGDVDAERTFKDW